VKTFSVLAAKSRTTASVMMLQWQRLKGYDFACALHKAFASLCPPSVQGLENMVPLAFDFPDFPLLATVRRMFPLLQSQMLPSQPCNSMNPHVAVTSLPGFPRTAPRCLDPPGYDPGAW